MQLQIVSDGTFEGTWVETPDGDRLTGVSLVSWSFNCEDMTSEATIHLWGVGARIRGEAIVVEDLDTATEYLE